MTKFSLKKRGWTWWTAIPQHRVKMAFYSPQSFLPTFSAFLVQIILIIRIHWNSQKPVVFVSNTQQSKSKYQQKNNKSPPGLFTNGNSLVLPRYNEHWTTEREALEDRELASGIFHRDCMAMGSHMPWNFQVLFMALWSLLIRSSKPWTPSGSAALWCSTCVCTCGPENSNSLNYMAIKSKPCRAHSLHLYLTSHKETHLTYFPRFP